MEEFELEPGETITLQVRQHVFVLFLKLVPLFILGFLPLFLSAVLAAYGGAPEALSGPFRFFLGVWWLFIWMGIFQIITKYFLTSWVITSHRILDIYQKGFFRRKVSSFLLVRVQDVTTNVHGILPTLIGFGDINVETAGSVEKFAMKGVRAPEYLRDLIMREVATLHNESRDMVKMGV